MAQVVNGRYTARMDEPFVVFVIGMRVNELRGLKTLLRFGPKISNSVAEQPDGPLLHENMLFSLVPPHGGMRQYWRDFESLERWARSLPHKEWWATFVRDTGARASGTSCTSCAAGRRRSTSRWQSTPSASLASHPPSPRGERCSQPGAA